MMGDEADDPFAVGWRQPCARVRQPIGQPVDPDASIRIEHDLDNRRVFKPRGDRRPQRGAQHARAARDCFRPE
jgi:hypothetical protein